MLKPQRLTDRQLRWFGLSLGGLPLAIAAVMAWRHAGLSAWTIGLGSLAVGTWLVYYGLPHLQRPIYDGFLRITYPIQLVMTGVILGGVYYVVLTPIGWWLRFRGYDPLSLRKPDAATSYWQPRREPAEADRYFKTF